MVLLVYNICGQYYQAIYNISYEFSNIDLMVGNFTNFFFQILQFKVEPPEKSLMPLKPESAY